MTKKSGDTERELNSELRWYIKRSREMGLPPRCPIANVHGCPRFFLSLSLLQQEGMIAGMDTKMNEELSSRWEASPHYPVVREEQPSITRVGDDNKFMKFIGASAFCPEVAYPQFGVFADALYKYADEEDAEFARSQLQKQGAGFGDPRREYGTIHQKHYTECREFSQLYGPAPARGNKIRATRQPISSKLRFEILHRDRWTCQYCGRKPPEVVLELDHRKPVADEGTNHPDNLVAACMDCNRGKGRKVIAAPDGDIR